MLKFTVNFYKILIVKKFHFTDYFMHLDSLPSIVVQRPQRVKLGYPWIYSNELSLTPTCKQLPIGSLVKFVSEQGSELGIGTLNRHALIAGRIYLHHTLHLPSCDWFEQKFIQAQKIRQTVYKEPFYRWVHAEADGLPGLVIDRYGDVCVVQLNTAGIELLQNQWLPALQRVAPDIKTWVLRKDSNSRALEQLQDEPVVIIGAPLDSSIVIGHEGPIKFYADVINGQKTGWFYDQRENRSIISRWIKKGDLVLDLFTHTGSFALYAALQGAQVDAVDRSELAISLARQAAQLNNVEHLINWHQEQVFPFLEKETQLYDMVIVDPPAFVKSKSSLAQGLQGYIKVVSQALQLVKPEGFLCFTSCSHLISHDEILEISAKAATKARKTVTVLAQLQAGFDHPIKPELPELSYLSGVLVRVQ